MTACREQCRCCRPHQWTLAQCRGLCPVHCGERYQEPVRWPEVGRAEMIEREMTSARRLRRWKMRHAGEVVAILACGPSLQHVALERLQCKTIGTNRSHRRMLSDYHVIIDEPQWTGPELDRRALVELGEERLVLPSGRPPAGTWYRALNPWPGFSFDLVEGVYVHTVTYVALQLAIHLGFTRIMLFGLDLCTDAETGEGHFYPGHHIAENLEATSREAFGYAAARLAGSRIQVRNCSLVSKLGAFLKATPEMLAWGAHKGGKW